MIEGQDAAGTSKLPDELDALGVVFRLDGFVASECLVRGRAAAVLEACGVERYRMLFAAQVLDLYGVLLGYPVDAWLARGRVVISHGIGFRAVLRRGEVHEKGVDRLRFRRHVVLCAEG